SKRPDVPTPFIPTRGRVQPCGLWLHRLEALDPLLDRRVRIEEPIEKARGILERVGDVERSGRFVGDLERLLVGGDFPERAGQARRVTREQGTRGIGEVLAPARDGEPYPLRDDRRGVRGHES